MKKFIIQTFDFHAIVVCLLYYEHSAVRDYCCALCCYRRPYLYPGRYIVENTGTTSGALTMQTICTSILSEAGQKTI